MIKVGGTYRDHRWFQNQSVTLNNLFLQKYPVYFQYHLWYRFSVSHEIILTKYIFLWYGNAHEKSHKNFDLVILNITQYWLKFNFFFGGQFFFFFNHDFIEYMSMRGFSYIKWKRNFVDSGSTFKSCFYVFFPLILIWFWGSTTIQNPQKMVFNK